MTTNKTVNVTEFKAKCLALFDEVETGKVSLTITRRGKAVAVVSPPPAKKFVSSRDTFAGKIEIVGDIITPEYEWDIYSGRDWDHSAKPKSGSK